MSMITPSVLYFCCVMVSMYIGDAISNATRGKVPQMFIVALIFVVAYLSGIFPKNIMEISGVNTVYGVISSMILIHVGTLFNFRQILNHYKSVLITLFAILGICLLGGGAGYLIYGSDIAASSIAPLTGGGMAAIIINQAAITVEKPQLGLFASMIFIFQGFVGFPLTAWFLRKECLLQLAGFNQKTDYQANSPDTENQEKPILIQRLIPEKYRNPLFYLTQLAILALLSDYIAHLTGVNYSIIEIFVGIICKSVGLLENQPLTKADSSTFLITCLFAWFMGSFANTTLSEIYKFAVAVLTLMFVACIAVALFCVPLGKKLGFSKWLSLAVGFNCFLGFPFNFALTNEAIRANAKGQPQADFLYQHLMPKMIVAGVISVSLLSAILAGLIASFYFHAG